MVSPRLAQQIQQALQGLRYGTVQLVIHDGRVVRIERIERIRLTEPSEVISAHMSQPTDSHDGGALQEDRGS